MPQGLQVWDDAGNLIVNTSDYLGKVLGVLTITAGVDDDITHDGFGLGEPFWQCTSLSSYATHQPTFSFDSGTNTLSWAWEGRSGADCKLVYGVF